MLEGGGVASGGLRELIPCIARTAVAVGVDGLFMEVHDDPLSAPVDGPTQWPLRHFEELLEELVSIACVYNFMRNVGKEGCEEKGLEEDLWNQNKKAKKDL
ncbi:2-dehydro-3-deoxyphosphooctonate aldolase 1 isoform X1 [Tanacetum coccineum]